MDFSRLDQRHSYDGIPHPLPITDSDPLFSSLAPMLDSSAPPLIKKHERTIAKAIAKKTAVQNLLKDPKIQILNEHDFLRWLNIAAPLIEGNLKNPMTRFSTEVLLFNLLTIRSYSKKEAIPLFREFGLIVNGKITKHPRYDWISSTEMNPETLDIHPEAALRRSLLFKHLQDTQQQHSHQTLENIHRAFSYICSKQDPAWEHTIGACYARATASIEHLLSLGFENRYLFTALLIGKNITVTTEEFIYTWRFHMAAGILLEDGTPYIFDPSTDPNAPMDVLSWEYKNRSENKRKKAYAPTILDRRDALITSRELNSYEKKKNNTIIFLPPEATCWNPGLRKSLSVTRSSLKDIITSHIDNAKAFETLSLKKKTIQTLEERFSHTPILLDILTGRQIFPDLPVEILTTEFFNPI